MEILVSDVKMVSEFSFTSKLERLFAILREPRSNLVGKSKLSWVKRLTKM